MSPRSLLRPSRRSIPGPVIQRQVPDIALLGASIAAVRPRVLLRRDLQSRLHAVANQRDRIVGVILLRAIMIGLGSALIAQAS